LAAEKKRADDAIAKATADAQTQIAAAEAAAKRMVNDLETNVEQLAEQLVVANAKIAELEAAASEKDDSGEP
jgi:hypothetical protein